jgi:hypothetical protein
MHGVPIHQRPPCGPSIQLLGANCTTEIPTEHSCKETYMTDPIAPSTIEPTALIPPPAAARSPLVNSGARWFWWIAGLSLVNIIMSQSGSKTSFVMGLGITAVSDALFEAQKAIGFGIDALILGLFFFLGQQALRGKLWAFYLGITLYALDALIYLILQDWMPVAFHALAIFFIARGAVALIASRQQST